MKYICPLIVVSNINRSRNFYEHILGQKVKYDFGEDVTFEGDFSIHLEEHFKSLLGNEHNEILKKANNFELYFEVEDVELTMKTLMKYEVEFIHQVKEQPWGQSVIQFYDPDYHIIEIGESMESVVLRYHKNGMNIEEVSNRTSMPREFVENVISKRGSEGFDDVRAFTG